MNYTASSLLAAVFAFVTLNASAAMSPDVQQAQVKDNLQTMTDVAEGAVTMEAMVRLTDGSTRRISRDYRTLQAAVEGYVRFVSSLPYGARLIRVQFTNASGEVLFASQG
ncbi:MAG: hypothetical protein ISP55_05840 [Flavobacteriales bacterium]|nr:hypothetical protein [Flavobacteriales bacterium]